MISPAEVAKFFLKINIIIAIITLGANTILIYPYQLYLTQIANNIAMDVSSKNYVTESETQVYFKSLSTDSASLYSTRTYIPGAKAFQGANTQGDSMLSSNSVSNNFRNGGIYVYTPALKSNSLGNEKVFSNAINVAVKSCNGKDLLLSADSSFNPITNNSHMVSGFDTTNYGGNLVQRGTAFQVEINTRYVITGLAMGAMINMVIPIKVESVGVTTQYYQYDKNLDKSACS